jgi:hypothetical protein
MSSFVLLDVTSYVGGFNLTTKMNQISMSAEADALDDTTFGNAGWRTRQSGLKDVDADLAGYWDNEIDANAYAGLGIANEAVSISPTGVEGETAYLWRGERFSYQAFGSIGALVPFNLGMMGSHSQGVARGAFLKAQTNVSATGATGTEFEIAGGIPSGAALYSNFHVFSVGTTITAVVESDEDDTFASATTRLTHGPLTAVGGNVQRIAGPITDTFFRLRVTAVTGTFSVACAIGIGG